MNTTESKRHWRQVALGLCAAAMVAAPLSAQDLSRLTPKALPSALERADPQDYRPQPAVDPQRERVVLERLKGLVLLQNAENLNPGGIPLSGVIAEGYQPEDLFERLSPYLGQPVSLAQLDEIVREIILAYRGANSPVVDAYVPNQDITGGTVQIVIVEGKVGEVRVEGNRWFKDELILSQVDLASHQTVRSDEVTADLNYLNRNPFRHTDLVLMRGAEPGTTDIVLQTKDRLPLRVYAGYENTGTEETGEDRLQLGVNWGNAFNRGHLLDYQYTGSLDFEKLMGHSLRYSVELPWRDSLVFNASYSNAKPDIQPFDLDATSYGLSGHYVMQLAGNDRIDHRFLAGFEYKYSDSNLDFADIPVFGKTTQILQFSAGYGLSLQDHYGRTTLGGQLVYSPGDLIGDNSAAAFHQVRDGADAQYTYVDLNVGRLTRLPFDFSWNSKARYKFADAKLLGSEQIGLGGYYSIRGFDERELNGDVGLVWNNELLAPNVRFGLFGGDATDFNLQLFGFFDYGFAEQRDGHRFDMSSVGAGFRMRWRDNLSVNFNYGQQLAGEDIDDATDGKVNVSATLSY